MLSVALSTLRVRWTSFVGTFVALCLGVGLMATAMLVIGATAGVADLAQQRWSGAPAVVVPDTGIDLADSEGQIQSAAVVQQPGLTPELVASVARTGRVVEDHTFYAQLAGGPADQVGRGWSAAEAGGYRLAAGAAPAEAGQVVVGGGEAGLIGRTLPLLTADGPRQVTVTGVTDAVPFEHAVFFTDAEATRISPAVDALAAYGPADAVRRAVTETGRGPGRAAVLTGKERATADPHHAFLLSQMDNVDTPLGLAAGVAGFVAVFVVAGTFALSIAQRRRELALLRLIGSTRRQLRRLIHAEAVLVGVLASAAGCGLGLVGAPLCRGWLVDRHIVSSDFTVPITGWALAAAATIGLVTAVVGVVVSSVRAGLISPGEALREAAVERSPKGANRFRWVVGGLALAAGVVAVSGTATMQPEAGSNAAASASLVLVIVGAFVTLAGVLAGPVIRLVTGLPARFSRSAADSQDAGGAVWSTARQSALTAFRRTAATTTPVVIVVSLAGCLLGSIGTINAAQVSAVGRQLSRTDWVVSPAGTPGLTRALVDRVRAVPGITAVVSTPTTVYAEEEGPTAVSLQAAAVDAAGLATVAELPVVSGSAADLGPGSIIVNSIWPGSPHAGDEVGTWLADGTRKTFKVAAVLQAGADSTQAYLDASDAGAGSVLPSRIIVKLAPGADREAASAALQAAVSGLGARISTPDEVSAAATDANQESSKDGMLMILGLSVLYALVALANTLVMTLGDRRRELAMLRLAGATRGQVLRAVATETLLCVGAGALVGAVASAISIGGSWAALHQLVGPTPAVVPWATLGELLALCAAIGLTAAVVPAALALRGGDGRSILAGIAGEAG
ncbi:FtsX-like permease family protein [Kitasatospora purpeofusca]|uniref:FtsX-like permease family protein n=1 Tax=Kitasatospora purpeofusca TaxID=67352 RepID=UPI002A59F25C|nr:FtsX-like permease family protein [Kitasatospora purpeofusca]MDY0812145.1 FtsX-like permease family protein [Kitasatospora purpeofusca]